jgi:Ca-activated chloride channel family protein
LTLEEAKSSEPRLSGQLTMSEETLSLLTSGEDYEPPFSSKFPAKMLHSAMTWDDLVLDTNAYDEIETIKVWINQKNNPDTLYSDDFPTYKVIAHTIPPTESKEIKLTQGKHTIIPIDAPQGFIELRRPMGVYNFNEKIKSIVRKASGNMQTLNVQQMNTTEKYITGSYDLEILTLPRTYMSGVKVEQSQTKILELPNAGMLTIKALDNGDGSIYKDTKKLEWVCNLNSTTSQTYYLQPGNYRIEWRAKSLKGSIYTIEKKFTVKSDIETRVELYK